MFNRRTLRSSNLTKKKRKRFYFKLAGFFAVLLILAGVIFFGSRMDYIAITDINVEGNSVLLEEEILEVVKEEISRNYFFLWYAGNTLFFPKSRAEEKLSDQFKRIEEVEISRDGLNEIEVLIKEREPEFTWCVWDGGIETEEEFEDECFFMDGTGFIFAPAPAFSGNVYFKFYGLIGKYEAMGSTYLPLEKFDELKEFKRRIEETGLTPSRAVAIEDGEFEIYLEEGSKIIFNSSDNLNQVALNLETILYEKRILEGMENFMSEIEYLDLSFGNKIFYK